MFYWFFNQNDVLNFNFVRLIGKIKKIYNNVIKYANHKLKLHFVNQSWLCKSKSKCLACQGKLLEL